MGRKRTVEFEDNEVLEDEETLAEADESELDEADDPDEVDVEADGRAGRSGRRTASPQIADDVIDEFDDSDVDLRTVDEALSHKDQGARSLAVRRALEDRLEAKRMSRDLDYLDMDLDD